MRNLTYSLKVRYIVSRVSDTFQIHRLRLVVDQVLEIFRLIPIDELCVDTQPREEDLELIVGSAVQIRRGHDVVAGMSECGNGHELSRLPRRGSDGGNAAFQGRNTLLEHIHRRLRLRLTDLTIETPRRELGFPHVHDTAVDVAKLLEAE